MTEERHDARVRALLNVARANADLKRPDEARRTLQAARQLLPKVQDPEIAPRLDFEFARLDRDLASLEKLVSRTARENLLELKFEARYARAEAELRAGRSSSARARLDKLAAEADKHGYALVARQARELK